MELLLFAVLVFWLCPMVIANDIGRTRNRGACWLYGFFLGWLGVLIVSCLSHLPSKAEIQVRELEARAKLVELQPPAPAEPRPFVQTPIFGWPKELKPSTYKRD